MTRSATVGAMDIDIVVTCGDTILKLDAILQKEREFDSDLENILQDKLKDFKEQWIDKMLDYYKNVWANIRKRYPTVKARYDELTEEQQKALTCTGVNQQDNYVSVEFDDTLAELPEDRDCIRFGRGSRAVVLQ